MNLRPMLAAKTPDDLDILRLPLVASPKIDGFRMLVVSVDDYRRNFDPSWQAEHAVALSRSLKPIANVATQELLDRPELVGVDGELLVGDPTSEDTFAKTTSALRRIKGSPDVVLHGFDLWNDDRSFEERMFALAERSSMPSFIKPLEQTLVGSLGELEALESDYLSEGYEGAIVRDPAGLYKHGRSTAKEQGLVKIKRFLHSEAVIVGVEERMHNGNKARTNELGRTARSTHQANMVPMGTLGAFRCRTAAGIEFRIGTGLTDAERADFWARRDTLVGQILRFKSFPVGVKDRPRFPVYAGLRAAEDL